MSVDRAGAPVTADLLDVHRLGEVVRGADAVVHLARAKFPYTASGYDAAGRVWKKPDPLGDAERFTANVAMTYNVLTAAFAAGARGVRVRQLVLWNLKKVAKAVSGDAYAALRRVVYR